MFLGAGSCALMCSVVPFHILFPPYSLSWKTDKYGSQQYLHSSQILLSHCSLHRTSLSCPRSGWLLSFYTPSSDGDGAPLLYPCDTELLSWYHRQSPFVNLSLYYTNSNISLTLYLSVESSSGLIHNCPNTYHLG